MVVGRRHVRTAQQVLAKHLAGFQLSGSFGGAEDTQFGVLERVDNPFGQWCFRANDRQSDLVLLGELDERGKSLALMSTFSASSAVPALPGATNTRSTREL